MALLCLLLLLFAGLLSNSQIETARRKDETTLLAIKKEISVPKWGFDGSEYCSWRGIRCGRDESSVEMLDLAELDLSGNVTLVSELRALKWLDLSYNDFHGFIPSAFGTLSELEFLDLSANKFEGSIPPLLGNLKNLKSLNLSNNLLTGEIPNELQTLKKLHDFQISGNMLNGSIPDWVGNLANLKVFTAYENELNGEIPNGLGSISELQLLNLHSNRLKGSIPESIFASGKLEVLVLTQNKLTGRLPESIGICKDLSSIRLGNNELVGVIPKTIGNISSLTYFEADNNKFSGEIASEFAQCSNLSLLNLASNGFTGTISPQLGQLTNLQELILSGNSLYGDIPEEIIECKNLNKLDLSNNRFNGTIPIDICNMSRLQYLLMGQNSISGEIPREIGNCIKLLELEMGSNYLTGKIPPEIGGIRSLQIALNLSFNNLHGPLPIELGKLDKLVSLDVSNNRLSGNIPSALEGMLSLIQINFSHNLFTGAVPIFVPFQKSPNSSFLGNSRLCGEPLSFPCGRQVGFNQESYHHMVSYRTAFAVIGTGLAVFVSVTVVVVLFMMREKQEKGSKAEGAAADEVFKNEPLVIIGNVFVENIREAVDFHAVVKATLKDSNKLHSGTFSTVYKATMPSGLVLSVKYLKFMDRTVIHHQSKVIRELERLSKLGHDNIMRPVGFMIYDDVALLLHNYFPNGTLSRFLHGSSNQPNGRAHWPTRLSISVGVAEALAFLHQLATVHLDISSGNVVLNADFEPLVGEVEISRLLDPSRGTASLSAVAGSFGYIPPEYAYTMQVTAPGNVYSYGVILLELLTSRQPVDENFGEGMDLVKWVHGAPARGETPELILDSTLSTVSFAWRKEMLAALKVALLCTDRIPAKRPKMKKVVEMLKEIKQK